MIYTKTPAGQQVVKDRSIALTGRQRSILILVDGKRTADALLQATEAAGGCPGDLEQLLTLGLVALSRPVRPVAEPAPVSPRTPQERYGDAYPLAVKLTGELGLRGFRLNLAVEAATTFEELRGLAPRIREAVGPGKYAALDAALAA